jgi:hypothetical protein
MRSGRRGRSRNQVYWKLGAAPSCQMSRALSLSLLQLAHDKVGARRDGSTPTVQAHHYFSQLRARCRATSARQSAARPAARGSGPAGRRGGPRVGGSRRPAGRSAGGSAPSPGGGSGRRRPAPRAAHAAGGLPRRAPLSRKRTAPAPAPPREGHGKQGAPPRRRPRAAAPPGKPRGEVRPCMLIDSNIGRVARPVVRLARGRGDVLEVVARLVLERLKLEVPI